MLDFFNKVIKPQSDALGKMLKYEVSPRVETPQPTKHAVRVSGRKSTGRAADPSASIDVYDAINQCDVNPLNIN